ncbi:MAG TPA: hypothetical protein VG055_17345 [Planctomycetaceae bacterium]|jgi:hypothetical protein|nr:hypothetical protein [Planctomycetaceae bacterium]
MAKKPEINQSAEIRLMLEQLGKNASFKDVFAKLQAKYQGRKFNENSCQQAFTMARKKLGFAKGLGRMKGTAATPQPTTAARVVRAAQVGAVRAEKGLVVDAMTTAQKLIAVCGGKEAAKHVIDNVTT